MKSVTAAILALLMSGCVSSSPPTPPPPTSKPGTAPVTLSDPDKTAIQAGVRASRPDLPATATFRTLIATSSGGVVTACGYVNGAAGEKPFIGTLTGTNFAMTGMGGTAEETIAVQTACAHQRINI